MASENELEERDGKEMGPRLLQWSRKVERKVSVDSDKAYVRRFRLFVDTLIYLFGREGTILISAISFSFLVSVFPIIVLLLSLSGLLGLSEFRSVIFDVLEQFFPISQEFIVRNLQIYTDRLGPPQLISLLLIAWAGSTFFFAVGAGLDSAFRVQKPRHFVHSQAVGAAMTLLSGLLSFCAIWLVGAVRTASSRWTWLDEPLQGAVGLMVSLGLTLALFLTLYLKLPNRRLNRKAVFWTAVCAALLWQATNWIFHTYSEGWSFQKIYGPFYVSLTILFWAYASGCILLGLGRLAADGFFGPITVREKTLRERRRRIVP